MNARLEPAYDDKLRLSPRLNIIKANKVREGD